MGEESYWAHTNEKTDQIQTVKEHSEGTAKLCYDFSIQAMKEFMYIMGLLHDVGKYGKGFQKRIRGANIRVEHSICGALAAREQFPNAAGLMMAYCIAGHHSGIPDAGSKNDTWDQPTLYGRLKHKVEEFTAYKEELEIPKIELKGLMDFFLKDCGKDIALFVDKFAFLTRYSFSCLVDADSLDTAAFCGENTVRRLKADFSACLKRVDERLGSFTGETKLQKSRSDLQRQVFEKADQKAEIYLMNMPTGSGKTLASFKFALERAIREGKKRIIYIIPYNSIIDQTAEIAENLFQEDGEILRHQSTFSYENNEDISEDYRNAAIKAAENWDVPLIITTAVQFFQSIYDNKRGKLRKLHNMADSILLFDEAHLMPQEYLQPCLRGIAYITRYLNSEAVFLTATMPNFQKLMGQYALKDSKILQLIEDTSLFSVFQTCKYHYLGKVSRENLVMQAVSVPSALVIVNRRAEAKELFKQCGGKKYHLSTYMTAYDRKNVLDKIREELLLLEIDFPDGIKVPENRRITIVSTSLIEAGVDLDVHTVFRELNGLDNILQAGGRCNREGKRDEADVFIFELEGKGKQAAGNEKGNIVKGMLERYEDISCLKCINEYYSRWFALKNKEIQRNTITNHCQKIEDIPFREYAEGFKLIDSPMVSLVVPRDERSRKLTESLRYIGAGRGIGRELQMYTCSVYQNELEDLIRQHAADDFGMGIYCLTNPDYYDEGMGVCFEAKDYLIE